MVTSPPQRLALMTICDAASESIGRCRRKPFSSAGTTEAIQVGFSVRPLALLFNVARRCRPKPGRPPSLSQGYNLEADDRRPDRSHLGPPSRLVAVRSGCL